jgi:hypothetical protein
VTKIATSLDDQMIRKMVLPKTKMVFERNSGDLKLTLNVLACLDQVIDRLDRSAIIDDVLPLLWDVKLQDPEIIQEVVSKFPPPPTVSEKCAAFPHCQVITSTSVELIIEIVATQAPSPCFINVAD